MNFTISDMMGAKDEEQVCWIAKVKPLEDDLIVFNLVL